MSNTSGGYVLELEAVEWTVVASAREHVPDGARIRLKPATPAQAVELKLRRGGQSFTGRVIDPAGTPIANARVFTLLKIAGPNVIDASVQADASGNFELWSRVDAELRALAPSFADLTIRRPEDHTLTLVPGSTISGRVVDRAGRGVAGAKVAVRSSRGRRSDSSYDPTSTDTAGTFELSGLLPGRYELLALSEDRFGESEALRVGYVSTRTDALIELDRPLRTLRARVVQRGGGPVGECRVWLARERNEIGHPLRTDQDGLLEVQFNDEGQMVVGLSCPGMVGTPPYAPIPVGKVGDELPRLEVVAGRTLRAQLLDAEGAPLANQKVRLMAPRPDFSEGLPIAPLQRFMTDDAITTDADGRFELAGLVPGGPYQLNVLGAVGLRDLPEVTISEGVTSELQLSMPPSGRIELQSSVARADQLAMVVLCDPGRIGESHDWEPDWARGWGSTNADGLASFEHVAPGDYVVSLSDRPECTDVEGMKLSVRAGQTTSLRLGVPASTASAKRREHEIDVTITDAGGQPAAGVVARLAPRDSALGLDWSTAWDAQFAVTDAEGRATLRYEVALYSPDQVMEVVAAGLAGIGSLAVPAGGTGGTIELEPSSLRELSSGQSEPSL